MCSGLAMRSVKAPSTKAIRTKRGEKNWGRRALVLMVVLTPRSEAVRNTTLARSVKSFTASADSPTVWAARRLAASASADVHLICASLDSSTALASRISFACWSVSRTDVRLLFAIAMRNPLILVQTPILGESA